VPVNPGGDKGQEGSPKDVADGEDAPPGEAVFGLDEAFRELGWPIAQPRGEQPARDPANDAEESRLWLEPIENMAGVDLWAGPAGGDYVLVASATDVQCDPRRVPAAPRRWTADSAQAGRRVDATVVQALPHVPDQILRALRPSPPQPDGASPEVNSVAEALAEDRSELVWRADRLWTDDTAAGAHITEHVWLVFAQETGQSLLLSATSVVALWNGFQDLLVIDRRDRQRATRYGG
jgi:hypothetical protein